METLKEILWPVVLVGGLGAFVDFLIGRTGQERAKDFLLRWWVRFDDVRWKSFGKEEGLFAAHLIGKWFGQRIWSFRRVILFPILLIVSIVIAVIKFEFITTLNPVYPILLWNYEISFPMFVWDAAISHHLSTLKLSCYFCNQSPGYLVSVIIVTFFGFSLSVSFTKFVTIRMAYLCGVGNFRNIIVFLATILLNILMLFIWTPLTLMVRESLLLTINEDIEPGRTVQMLNEHMEYMDNFALGALPLLVSLFRLVLSMIFVGSFLLRPLIMHPVSLVWARIVESEKPVFTVIFGGAAAFATAISEAAKHL